MAFGASPETDFSASLDGVREQLRSDATVIIGAFEETSLAGCVFLLRPRHAKARHKLHLWGMYVSRAQRRRGIGLELLRAAIDAARAMPGVCWIELGVTSESTAARELYARAGFEVWGTERDALRDEGRSVDEVHMALRLQLAHARPAIVSPSGVRGRFVFMSKL